MLKRYAGLLRLLQKMPRMCYHQLNSYLGVMSHFSAYYLTKKLFFPVNGHGGYFTRWMKKWVEYPLGI